MYWRNSIGLEAPTQIAGIIPDILPYQAQIEMALRNGLQARVARSNGQEPLRVYLYNQMSANNYNNQDWFSLVKSMCETVLYTTSTTRRPIIESINGSVEMVLEHFMARAISRDPDLQRMLDQSQVNTVNKVLADMQQHGAVLENFLQRYMATYQQQANSIPVANPWPTAGIQLADQNQQYQNQQPVQLQNGFTFAPVVGQVQQPVYQQPQQVFQPQQPGQPFQWQNAPAPQQPQAMQFYNAPQVQQPQVVYHQQPVYQPAPQPQSQLRMNNPNEIPLYVPPAPQQQNNVPFQFAPVVDQVQYNPTPAAANMQNFSVYTSSGSSSLEEAIARVVAEERAKEAQLAQQQARQAVQQPMANGRNPIEGQERPAFNYATTEPYNPNKPVTANPYVPAPEQSDEEFWDTLTELEGNPDGSMTLKFSSGKEIVGGPTRMAVEPNPGVAQPYREPNGMRPVSNLPPAPQYAVSDEQPIFLDDLIHKPLFCKATHWLDVKNNCIRRRNYRMNYEEHELDDNRISQADKGKVIPTYIYDQEATAEDLPEIEPSGSVDFSQPIIVEDILTNCSTATAMSFLKFAHNTYDAGTPLEFSNLNAEAITLVDKKAFKADCPNLFFDNLPRNVDQVWEQLGKCAGHSGMLFKILDQRATAATNKILNVGMGLKENITSFLEDWPELVKYIKRVYGDEGIKGFTGGLSEVVYATCCLASGDLENFLLKQSLDSLVPTQVSGMTEKDKKWSFETPQVVGMRRKNLLPLEQRNELLNNTVVLVNPEYVVMVPATMEDLCLTTENNKVLTISETLCGPLYQYLYEVLVRINSREVNYSSMVLYTYEGERFELMPAALGDPSLFCARHIG